MRPTSFRKGAPVKAAPFSFVLLSIGLLALPARSTSTPECPATQIDERVRVTYVYDGDTVKLADGRRLRLVGINTPELARKDEAGEPLAQAARASLQNMLDNASHILQLEYGTEHNDHYGRLLAHAYLENGDNVAARLLQQGLATALVVPPNTRAMHCYQRLEDAARSKRLGLWALPQYQTLSAGMLPADTSGFRIVRGRVTATRTASRSIWLDLQGPLKLHIRHQDRTNFAPGYLENLTGQEVEVRGWIKSDHNGLRMNIRHPAALVRLSAGNAN